MIRLKDVSLPLTYDEAALRKAAAKKLNIDRREIQSISLYKRSIDARKKEQIHFLAAVDVQLFSDETAIAARCQSAEMVEEL